MKWYNAGVDKLPEDKQEVLVSSAGINHIAVYNAEKKIFIVSGKPTEEGLSIEKPQLYWTELLKPSEEVSTPEEMTRRMKDHTLKKRSS